MAVRLVFKIFHQVLEMTDSLEMISARRAAPKPKTEDRFLATCGGGRRAVAVAARSFFATRHLTASSLVEFKDKIKSAMKRDAKSLLLGLSPALSTGTIKTVI